ncbi:MAG: M20/M25/M40 family metallo-hydrolase [Candidatus Diapherotrites archaeon]|uniref:M20/M25/M40 family metallo-hydrolase n=1 Tax=Candidatus Iainarchaeum sp. TaxID=3101447 RepID=A0A8T3YKY0_9ARCH|nr:M20/M25/M40 family metallo-hydrolase [Candidatus Diapherotrites archaeon]
MHMEYMLRVLRNLVSINTNAVDKANYAECASYIDSEASEIGMKSRIISFKGSDGKIRPSVLAEASANAGETVLFVTHFDVVPEGQGWKTNPFSISRKGNRLYGRGVSDDKGGIAAFLAGVKEALHGKGGLSRNIKFLAVCDEEVGGDEGIGLIAKRKPRALASDFCIVLDGHLDYFSTACCGIVRGWITLKGKGGHAGYDFQTGNMLHNAIPFMQELLEYRHARHRKRSSIDAPKNGVSKKIFGRFNITILDAGTQFNVIPSELKIGFDLRTLPEENPGEIAHEFRRFASLKARKHSLKAGFDFRFVHGYYTKNKKYAGIVKSAAEEVMHRKMHPVSSFGATDARYVSTLGIPAFNFGPGGKNVHTNTESITLQELGKTKEFVKKIIANDPGGED